MKAFIGLVNGTLSKGKTTEQIKAIERYNHIQLCREFGWTEQDIMNMTTEFYNDCLLILSMERSKQKADYEQEKRQSKFRK